MTELWKIYLLILFLGLTTTPTGLVYAEINVPAWALMAGHIGAVIFGFIAANLDRSL